MIGVLVVSHEPLGTALIRCTRHVYGRLPPQLAALDVIPDEDPVQACQAARDLLVRINDGSGVIVFTDLFGATPSRIARTLADPQRVAVIAGVNLPLLLKALNNRRCALDEVVATLVDAGRRAIFEVEPCAPDERPLPSNAGKASSGTCAAGIAPGARPFPTSEQSG